MKNVKVQDILAIAGVLFVFALVFTLLFVSVPKANKDLFNTSLGVLLGSCVTAVFTYYFGSSKGSADKNEMLKEDKK